MIELNSGIKFGESLILDPTRRQKMALVSHAHSDHLRKHRKIYAHKATLDFARLIHDDFQGIPLEYGRQYRIDDCLVRPEPAGHILGSTQFIVDYAGYRIVYTGDLKLTPNETCPPAEIHECDILFIDTTFGKKTFNFPDYGYIKQSLLEFVDSCLYSGLIPIIFAYNLGKAQEVMKILGDAGYHTYASHSACANAEIHREHGVSIANFHELTDEYPENGAIVLPPSYRYLDDLFPGYRKRACFVSGWVLNMGYLRSASYDEHIPLSDHASYNDIIRYVEAAKPTKVYCLFGFEDIVTDLKRRGFNAVRATLANRQGVSRQVLSEFDLFKR